MSNSTALVFDLGLYPHIATALATTFDRVGYFTPYNAEAFPVSRRAFWGAGLPSVERVRDFWDWVDDADLIAFPDLGQGDLQAWLRAHQHRVWGAAQAEVLEQDRAGLKRLMLAKGMNRPPTWIIQGIEALGEHLRDPKHENQHIKISEFRGDAETMKHINWWLTQPQYRQLAHRLGPIGEHTGFVAEANIEGIEIGFDGITVDGRFPAAVLWGMEAKDIAYLGRVCTYDELPEQLRSVNADLAPVLEELKCRSMFSTEVRVDKEGKGTLIDATLRTPSPPGGGICALYTNLADVMAHGADGELIEPIPQALYVAELILRSDWATDDFLAIRFPEEHRHLVKLHGHAIIDGVDYVVALGIDTIGEVVGLGQTLDEAIGQCLEVAGSIEAHQLEFDEHGFDILKETIDRGLRSGVNWE